MGKKLTIVLVTAIAMISMSTNANAADLCWTTTDGNFIEVTLQSVAPGVFSVNGSVDSHIAVAGTALDLGTELQLAMTLNRAEVLSTSVTWQFDLDPVTLDGPGYWRWFAGEAEGSFSADRVSCLAAHAQAPEQSLATGDQ